MKFLLAVIDSTLNPATGDEIAAIDAFNDALRGNGHLVLALGLHEPNTAVVLDNRADRDGNTIEESGSLFTSDEHYTGMWIIDVPDNASAHRLALDASRACNRRVELRQFHGH